MDPYYLEAEYVTYEDGVEKSAIKVYQTYDNMTCSVKEAEFANLTEAQALAKWAELSLTQPTVTGYTVQERSCTPPVSTLYGDPRTRLGQVNGNANLVYYAGTNIDHLILVVGTNPDQFFPKGVNVNNIVLDAGKSLPAGVSTDYNGQAPPTGFQKPAGYRIRYGKKQDGTPDKDSIYYEQSNQPDEVLPGSNIVVQGSNAGYTPDQTTPTNPTQPSGGTSGDDPAAVKDQTTEDPDSIEYREA